MLGRLREHKAQSIKPAFNVNTLIDHLTGEWRQGADGESYLVGGYNHRMAISGGGNVGKTQLALQLYCSAMNRYYLANGQILDTEDSMPASRPEETSARLGGNVFTVEAEDIEEDEKLDTDRCVMIDGKTELMLDKWFDICLEDSKAYAKEWKKNPKKYCVTYPWLQADGQHKQTPVPIFALIDSFSEADTTSAANTATADGVDSSKGNTQYMRDGAIKGTILSKMPQLQALGGMFVMMTAAFGDKMDMNAMPGQAPKKAMTDTKGGQDWKKVSSNFKRMTVNSWMFETPKLLLDSNKMPNFPYDDKDNFKGNADLRTVDFYNTRGKNGAGSGTRYQLVQSQSFGVLDDLSNYYFLTNHPCCTDKTFGQDGATTQYRTLNLYPNLKFQRTDVRRKLDADPLFRKALEFTTSLKLEFFAVRHREVLDLYCTPKELYEDLEKLGYDWSILLDTRSYWMFKEWENAEHLKPYLSVLDLLRMRKGLYHPKWYKEPLKPKK